MLKSITVENIDEEKWTKFKAKCILNHQTIQEGLTILLDKYNEDEI